MDGTLNHEEQVDFVRDIVGHISKSDIMEKFKLSEVHYSYYRRKLAHLIAERTSTSEKELRANYNLFENRRHLSQVWTNLEELIAFKKTVCDRTLYDKVVLEIENLSILYSEALAYDKPIVVPERLKELDDEQKPDISI